ncbi:MAG: Trm112 family protein [Deltaproteobacteria bacterium]|nr:Trm112 family protein [Deltaproteobacteria bacterium]
MKELSDDLLKVLVCPECKGGLDYSREESRIVCRSCGLVFPIRNGIPVMLVGEAVRVKQEN